MSFRMGMYEVPMDFVLSQGGLNEPMVVSAYERSLQTLKGFSANLQYSGRLFAEGQTSFMVTNDGYDSYFTPIIMGKEKFYHMVAISKKVRNSVILSRKEDVAKDFYQYLMEKFSLPLMERWADALYHYFSVSGYVSSLTECYRGKNSVTKTLPLKEKPVLLDDVVLLSVRVTDEALKEAVTELLENGKIWISEQRQKDLSFSNMDEYFREYGSTLVENLQKQIEPLTELDGVVRNFTLKHLRLYPQQIAQVNGAFALLEKQNYLVMNHGMGTGKTLCGSAVAEGLYTSRWLRNHPGKTLKDLYMDPDNIKYRHIVMCPGHLVEKWAKEIRENVPYSKVTILNDFSQLIKLRAKGRERTGREFFVVSKDFGKLSYTEEPAVRRIKTGFLEQKVCCDCGQIMTGRDNFCQRCNKPVKFRFVNSGIDNSGACCPSCQRILIPYKNGAKYDEWAEDMTQPLVMSDFDKHRESNDKCFYCGESLWQPRVANVGSSKVSPWMRVTHYANKAHKGKKTVWVHKRYQREYYSLVGEEPLNVAEDRNSGSRKYSPVLFIKKYMKGFFDLAIFDEAHMYKGGGTGQGHAMHCLVKASKKQLALTGTIAGGYANHLFYLLWRLEPSRMKKEGFAFTEELRFSDLYGCVEREFAMDGSTDSSYNSSTHGRQLTSPKVKPGISPLIFSKFLLDRATFLDLTDMSSHLPDLKERVVTASFSEEEQAIREEYIGICTDLSKRAREGAKGLLGTMLQFSLSYLDRPYGADVIKDPKKGFVIAEPKSFDEFADSKHLLSKEKKLVELVQSELAEGRNCVVYAEYTASPSTCITYRLKEVLERECNLKGRVTILESAYPSPREREAWMHEKATEGTKVFITNPKCVETGLDFCWSEGGKEYNYPTLIFYQMGYSMFTISQASRRHYRLNQKKECRTYYFAWAGTVQEEVIRLIAEKQVATSAIQGKFSTEGLAAMASGVDTRVKLAQAMSNMDQTTGNNLQEMFDVINQSSDEDAFCDTERMLLLHELLGDEVPVERTLEEVRGKSSFDPFAMFNMFAELSKTGSAKSEVKPEAKEVPKAKPKPKVTAKAGPQNLFAGFEEYFVPVEKMSKKQQKLLAGQVGFF